MRIFNQILFSNILCNKYRSGRKSKRLGLISEHLNEFALFQKARSKISFKISLEDLIRKSRSKISFKDAALNRSFPSF